MCEGAVVRITGVDQRNVRWQIDAPAYRVRFWSRADGPSGEAWECEEWRLTQVADAVKVVRWAQAQSAGRVVVVYVEVQERGRAGLVRLLGEEPRPS